LPRAQDIIGVVFDFDGTLVPDSITTLLRRHRIDPKRFWLEDAKKLTDQGYDQVHAYLNLLLRNIGPKKPLGNLTNADLRSFGSTLKFYPGIPEVFNDLKKLGKMNGVEVKFFIISSGLQDIIEGSKIFPHFEAVYGSQLAGDDKKGVLQYIKRCITYTEKTRYLFEINKGIPPKNSHRDYVNETVPMEERLVPFSRMIFIGDGLTDIPCFSLVKNGVRDDRGGIPFGIFNPRDEQSARRVLLKLLLPDRVEGAYTAKYGPLHDLGSALRNTVTAMASLESIREQPPWRPAPESETMKSSASVSPGKPKKRRGRL
jgi:phosphoserine phosphatase